jgi:proteasome alpha subunit
MAMFTAPGGYDRAITVFSPDGRLFQVEYALETVKRGATVLGIACPEGVVLAAEESPVKLQDSKFSWKIFQIDEHLGVAVAGLSSDARILIDQARIFAQSNRLLYDEPIDVEVLSKRVGDIKQLYTQHAGVRPFGVAMIFGGVDKSGCRIFQTGPSGECWGYKATAVGMKSDVVKEILDAEYKDGMSLEDSILLAIKSLAKVIEGKITSTRIIITIIPAETRQLKRLSDEEIAKYVKKLGLE